MNDDVPTETKLRIPEIEELSGLKKQLIDVQRCFFLVIVLELSMSSGLILLSIVTAYTHSLYSGAAVYGIFIGAAWIFATFLSIISALLAYLRSNFWINFSFLLNSIFAGACLLLSLDTRDTLTDYFAFAECFFIAAIGQLFDRYYCRIHDKLKTYEGYPYFSERYIDQINAEPFIAEYILPEDRLPEAEPLTVEDVSLDAPEVSLDAGGALIGAISAPDIPDGELSEKPIASHEAVDAHTRRIRELVEQRRNRKS